MSFRSIEHTADLAVEVTAPSRDALFAEVVPAFTDLMVEVDGVEPREARQFELEAAELPLLLVDWLSELLYRFEVDGLLFRRAEATIEDVPCDVCSMGAFRLRATVWGEPRDEARHPIKVLLKAVTYHGLTVGPIEGSIEGSIDWRARIVFDI